MEKLPKMQRIGRWLRTKNMSLFRIAQFLIWVLRYFRSNILKLLTIIVLMSGGVVFPFIYGTAYDYRYYSWGLSVGVGIVFSCVLVIAFINHKVAQFSRNEVVARQTSQDRLKDMLEGLAVRTTEDQVELQKTLEGLAARTAQDQLGLASRLDSETHTRSELQKTLEGLAARTAQDQLDLASRLDSETSTRSELQKTLEGLAAKTAQDQLGLANRLDSETDTRSELQKTLEGLAVRTAQDQLDLASRLDSETYTRSELQKTLEALAVRTAQEQLGLASRLDSETDTRSELQKTLEGLAARTVEDQVNIQNTLEELAAKTAEDQVELASRIDTESDTRSGLKKVLEELIAKTEQEQLELQQTLERLAAKTAEDQGELASRLNTESDARSEFQRSVEASAGQQEHRGDEIIGRLNNHDRMEKQLQETIDEVRNKTEAILFENLDVQENNRKQISDAIKTLEEANKEIVSAQGKFETNLQKHEEYMTQIDIHSNILSNASVFNNVGYQAFNRQLNSDHIEMLTKQWSKDLNINATPKSLSYIANRICNIESICKGRLAASIEDVVLRSLVASAVKSESLHVLEIGTLFGIGLAAIYDHNVSRFDSVELTAIDPLDGYYGKFDRDILTDELVDENVFRSNLSTLSIPEKSIKLIKGMSTDDDVLREASKSRYDILILDGDHTYGGVKSDYVNYIKLMKRGSYIIFDDYGNPHWQDIKRFVDDEVMKDDRVTIVGSSWVTAVFRVVNN